MYADRYAGRGRIDAGGLAAAIGVTTAIVGALAFAAPEWVAGPPKDPPITIVNVPLPPIPKPIPPEPQPQDEVRPSPQPYIPKPIIAPPQPLDPGSITSTEVITPPGPITGTPAGTGSGEGTVAVDPPARPVPMLVGAALDPRYARELQPPYPPSEQREGNDGRVTVRVRIGADGRVKEVRRVSATSDAFFRATERQALSRWRFRPATRDGVAEEGWKTMSVTFVLEG